ncbi:MAG: YchJ family metal-binding protein [Pseudomonadota bacterium]
MTRITPTPCPCGKGPLLGDCCAPLLAGQRTASDAETLMRSRYTAYVLGNEAYLLATWHPDTRPEGLDLDREPHPRWLGLAVKGSGQVDVDHAWVEFVARYKIAGRAYRMQERSRFERREGTWYYLDGEVADSGHP